MERMFSQRLGRALAPVLKALPDLQEIRLRAGRPLLIRFKNREYGVDEQGRMTKTLEAGLRVNAPDVKETLDRLCQYSLYAYADEMRQGFLTIKGGHRVGLCGQMVVKDGQVDGIRHISSLNIRIAHQVPGCGAKVLPRLFCENSLCHTLIVAPPGCGKTTLLRDIVRLLSNGGFLDGLGYVEGMTVGVADERSEIGACYQGVAQNDLGIRTDVMDNCPKAMGVTRLIRTMSPQVIAVDELGGDRDMEAVLEAAACGCRVIATMHGQGREDADRRFFAAGRGKPPFEKYVVLSDKKTFDRIPDVIGENGMERSSGRYMCG